MISAVRENTISLISSRLTSYILIASIFACIGLYIYFANTAVRTLALLEKTKEEMQVLSVEVSEMEAKRLFIDNSLGSVMARSLGFVEVTDQTFIVNKSKKTALSFNTD